MSVIREYLEEKLALGEKEWLRRDPLDTHPAILSAVCAATDPDGKALFYNDEVEQFVEECAGDLPPHRYHAHPDRHPLTYQLGHEVYIARIILREEEATADIIRALDDGFVPIADAKIVEGKCYLIRFGTLYSGYSVAQYGQPREVRAKSDGHSIVFLKKGAQTNGYRWPDHALVKEA